jgi:hypothetical protein
MHIYKYINTHTHTQYIQFVLLGHSEGCVCLVSKVGSVPNCSVHPAVLLD